MPQQNKEPSFHICLSLSLCVLWLSMFAHTHTHSTYVTSPVSCTTLSSVVLPWKEQLSWEVFWPYPALSFNVYLTHARTPLPSYSHVRAEYYENTANSLTCCSRLFTIYRLLVGWVTLGFLGTQDCSSFNFALFILICVFFIYIYVQ